MTVKMMTLVKAKVEVVREGTVKDYLALEVVEAREEAKVETE